MGRLVQVPIMPKRIVSLVPSQTELLYTLGLDEEVVGQTIFCVHPQDKHQQKPRVGGTKNFKLSQIQQLKPDLIIGNKEENSQAGIEELMSLYPVWMSDIADFDDAIKMIEAIGDLIARSVEANNLVLDIKAGFGKIPTINQAITAAYFIWRNPWMVAANGTFINNIMQRIGLVNVFANKLNRYPEVSILDLQEANPQLILLSSEPYPFAQKHINELQILMPHAHIQLVDGEMFSWYGSRLLLASSYLSSLQQQLNHQFNS